MVELLPLCRRSQLDAGSDLHEMEHEGA
jgi:hypothetical protein